MKSKVIYSVKSREDLKKMDFPVAKRIIKKINYFSKTEAPLKFAKPISNKLFGQYRFRVGDYRVLFDKDRKGNLLILKILRIKHRKDVYL